MKRAYNTSYHRAKHRVERIKKFYTHLAIYLVVNIIISIVKIVKDLSRGDAFEEAMMDGDNFGLWKFWGVFLVIHFVIVFALPKLFGYDWEARKIEEFMKEDEQAQ